MGCDRYYILRVDVREKVVDSPRLEGRALQVAVVVGVVLLGAALWAGAVDFYTEPGRNPAPLGWLDLAYKLISIAALVYVANRWNSRSLRILALLLALLEVGHLLVHTRSFNRAEFVLIRPLADALSVSRGVVMLGGIFVALAIIGIGMVWLAYRAARPDEKPVVVKLIAILIVLGIFTGPVNAISALGINREWLIAEDFGQVLALAVLAAYSIGLAVAAWERPGRLA